LPTGHQEKRLNPLVLLFDLDGTLMDSQLGIVRCFQYALGQLGRPCPADAVLASFIGPPLRSAFATLLAGPEPAAIERAVALYRQRLADVGLYENRVYDGVPAMLARAQMLASALYVVTSKMTLFARRGLAHFALDHAFTDVYGCEPDGRLEDKAELLAHVLATERIPAEAAIMIGDRAVDILAARANGVSSIGVLWGYGSEAELVDGGVDELCVAPHELDACVSRIVARRETSTSRQ
jgi:phosphoglycolate phosphatase